MTLSIEARSTGTDDERIFTRGGLLWRMGEFEDALVRLPKPRVGLLSVYLREQIVRMDAALSTPASEFIVRYGYLKESAV